MYTSMAIGIRLYLYIHAVSTQFQKRPNPLIHVLLRNIVLSLIFLGAS